MIGWINLRKFLVEYLTNGIFHRFDLSISRIWYRFILSSKLIRNSNPTASQKRVFSPKWIVKNILQYYNFFFLSPSPALPPFSTQIHILPSPKIRSGFLFPVWLSRLLARRGDAFIYFCITFRFSIVRLPHRTTQNLYCAPNVHSCGVRVCVSVSVRSHRTISRKMFFFIVFFFLFFVHIWRFDAEKTATSTSFALWWFS